MYVIRHSAKGTTWSDHKYIRKEGNRYIYAEDKTSKNMESDRKKIDDDQEAINNVRNKIEELENKFDESGGHLSEQDHRLLDSLKNRLKELEKEQKEKIINYNNNEEYNKIREGKTDKEEQERRAAQVVAEKEEYLRNAEKKSKQEKGTRQIKTELLRDRRKIRSHRNHTVLKHHGILGQKWGKRNGPPYPLDADDHSTAEKNAMNNHPDRGGNPKESYNPDKAKAPEIKKQKFKNSKVKEPFDKDEATKNVDLKSVYKHRKDFTYEELSKILQRYELEKKYRSTIKEMDKKQRDAIIAFLNGQTDNMKIANNTLSEIAKLADNLAKFIPKSK